jgi:hypothetical protein
MLMLESFAIKVRLTFCVLVSVGDEADLGLELARRVCLRHDVRRELDRESVLCDALSSDDDMLLLCL